MATLERALEIAKSAHAGQVDKAGRPYIEHVLRVVDAVEGEDAKVVAALHDVLEDGGSHWLKNIERAGVSKANRIAVAMLTRASGEPYAEYINQLRGDRVARAVKIADLRDNSDPARLALLPERDRERLSRKYAAALKQLGAAADHPTAAKDGGGRDG